MEGVKHTFCRRGRLALLLLVVCMAMPVQARRVYVHGRVYDEGGDPVELATVNEEHTLELADTFE